MHAMDARPVAARLYLLPVATRMPLKFGSETLTEVTCARVCITVRNPAGQVAEGWGETPLNVQWVWPSPLPYHARLTALLALCERLVTVWGSEIDRFGHPLLVGHQILEEVLTRELATFNAIRTAHANEPVPWLAALVCCSAFDLALHDAYGQLHGQPIYQLYARPWLDLDLASILQPADRFAGRQLGDFLHQPAPPQLTAWHLVGGADPLENADLLGTEPRDGYPVTLRQWIQSDGLQCLKIKLRGNATDWDFQRLLRVGQLALEHDVRWLSADFNCTVTDPTYVTDILDRLLADHPAIYARLLYVEQPFPYELDTYQIDARPVGARKPVFLDESAHDWRQVQLGRSLGWSGVALKTCKTQTGALLALCWAKAHQMPVMVQDLTNPMLAQISHVQLAAHAATIQGVETNAMQFYPDASRAEAAVHPGLYQRRHGMIDRTSLAGPGFGYRLAAMDRHLPTPVAQAGAG